MLISFAADAFRGRGFSLLVTTKTYAPAVTRRKDIGRPISFQREQHELKAPQEMNRANGSLHNSFATKLAKRCRSNGFSSDEDIESVPAKRVRRKGNQHFLVLVLLQ